MITLTKVTQRSGGQWKPGQSGNPTGKNIRVADFDVAAMARQYTPEAIKTLVVCLHDPRYKLAAAVALLDRGYGKPHVSVHTQSESTVLHLVAAQEVGSELLNALIDSERPTLEGDASRAPASDDQPTE